MSPPSHRRGPWVPEEDRLLMNLVRDQGPTNWVRISQHIHYRSPKQCRERFHQNLKPSLNRTPISAEEGLEIERLVNEMGKRWAEIARRLGNRSDNAVKNWWNGSVNRKKRGHHHHSGVLDGRVESIYPRASLVGRSRYLPSSTTPIHVFSTGNDNDNDDDNVNDNNLAPFPITTATNRPIEHALSSPAYSEVSSSSSSSASSYVPSSIESPNHYSMPSSTSPRTTCTSTSSPQFLPPPVNTCQHQPHHYYYNHNYNYSDLRRRSLPSLMSDDGASTSTASQSCPSSSASSPFLPPLSLTKSVDSVSSSSGSEFGPVKSKPCLPSLPTPGNLLSSSSSSSIQLPLPLPLREKMEVPASPPRDSARISLDKLLN